MIAEGGFMIGLIVAIACGVVAIVLLRREGPSR